MADLGRSVLKFIKDEQPTRKQVLQKFGISISEFNEILKEIKGFNHEVVYVNRHYGVSRTFRVENDVVIIQDGNLEPVELFMSDTHSSDKGCNHRLIQKVVKEAYARGVRIVYHAGDLVAGRTVYPGQIHDLRDITFEDQVSRLVDTLPALEGLEYYVINGNHDLNWLKLDAGNVGRELASRREDVHFLGDGYGRVVKNGVRIDLVHLDGSGSNGQGKVEKYLGNFMKSNADDAPHILLAGHLHKMLVGNDYGVEWMLPGNFQGPNQYVKRKGLLGPQGAYLVDYEIDRREVTHFRTERLQG